MYFHACAHYIQAGQMDRQTTDTWPIDIQSNQVLLNEQMWGLLSPNMDHQICSYMYAQTIQQTTEWQCFSMELIFVPTHTVRL